VVAMHCQPGHEYEDLSIAIQPRIDHHALAETVSMIVAFYLSMKNSQTDKIVSLLQGIYYLFKKNLNRLKTLINIAKTGR